MQVADPPAKHSKIRGQTPQRLLLSQHIWKMDQPKSNLALEIPATGLRSGDRRKSSRLQPFVNIYSDNDDGSAQIVTSNSSRGTSEGISVLCTLTKTVQDLEPDQAPSIRTGLRLPNTAVGIAADPLDEALKPLTDGERRDWKGWVELESDPALFSFILRQYGVKDVKIQEVVGLEDEVLAYLPKPVYGLVFLFKYRDEEEESNPKCPKNVWFANQTITNACATIALLNIVMNVKGIDLGRELTSLRSDTQNLKPAYRGKRLGRHDFIRNIHNSSARRMDMLNGDLAFLNEMDKWKRARTNTKKKIREPKSKKIEDDDDSGFHFIAYVPINGEVWKLDGLQTQPINLGQHGPDWMEIARSNIQSRIEKHGEDQQYSLLSLCQSPLLTIPQDLAANICSISLVESTLTTVLPDWKQFLQPEELGLETGPNDAYGLTDEILKNANAPPCFQRQLRLAGTEGIALMKLYTECTQEQARLKVSFMEETTLIGQEGEQAARRKFDYTPIIYKSIKTLAEEGVLKKIIEFNQTID